jgi:hypothetical protein
MGVLGWELTPTQTILAAGVTALLTLVLLLRPLPARKVHPSEPTVISSWIPFIGHLLGMAMYGGKYVKKLG